MLEDKRLERYEEQVASTISSVEVLLDKAREKLESSSLTDDEFEEVETLLLRAFAQLYVL